MFEPKNLAPKYDRTHKSYILLCNLTETFLVLHHTKTCKNKKEPWFI